MLLQRNIRSEKHFIYLKDVDWEKFQVITPLNQIKIVERHLFEDEIEGDGSLFLKNGWITTKQYELYIYYQRIRKEENLDFFVRKEKQRNRQAHFKILKTPKVNPIIIKQGGTMKTIEVDDEVYAYLQNQAEPFEEPTPNHVIRRLLGIHSKPRVQTQLDTKPVARKPNCSKAPKTNIKTLIQHGILSDGQSLYLRYKSHRLSKEYVTKISGDKLLYEGSLYTMSRLVAEILEPEGYGIPSKAYRGPEYWFTSDGISIRQLWEKFIKQ